MQHHPDLGMVLLGIARVFRPVHHIQRKLVQNGVHKRILSALFWAMDHSGTDGAGAGAASVAESFRGHFRKYGTCNTGGAAAFPVFAQVWSE